MILASLLTWKVKAIAASALVLGAVWYHKHEMARVYSEAATETTEKLLKEQAGEVDKKVQEALSGYALERADLEAQRKALTSERAGLSSQRRAISDALKASIAEISTKNVDVRHEIEIVPDSAVNGRFRVALERARAAERAAVNSR